MADQTSGSIEVAAPPAEVMAVIADIAQYPAWVDSMSSAEVLTSADGHPETVRMVLDHPIVKDDYVLRYTGAPPPSAGSSSRATCSRRWTAPTLSSPTAPAAP